MTTKTVNNLLGESIEVTIVKNYPEGHPPVNGTVIHTMSDGTVISGLDEFDLIDQQTRARLEEMHGLPNLLKVENQNDRQAVLDKVEIQINSKDE